ncbi:MAG: AraC family ethanolamine operon transcriptional activator, partial [Phenylobacterium sp.]
REQLNAGTQIEAAPPGNFFPLATVLNDSTGMRFCGKEFQQNSLLQASGSEWNVRFNEKLEHIGCILDKTMLAENTERLTGRPMSPNWFISQACQVEPGIMANYKNRVCEMLLQLSGQATLLNNPDIRRLFSAEIFQLVINMLSSTLEEQPILMPHSRRLSGVRRVVEYLNVHASYLPTIPELCTVAQLSERSLEYGFKEQLGVTPVRYLKLVRLNGSKHDLVIANPKMTKVVDIALRWGFVEFGRFAAEYGRLFKELPSQTLRRV